MILAFICGYFLCLSGSLCQLVTNNNIASPSTLGMDALGVLVVIIAQGFIIFFDSNFSLISISLMLTTLSLFILFFVNKFYLKSQEDIWSRFDIKKIVLIGLSFNLFVGAIFSVIQFMFMALNFEFPSGLWFGSFKQVSQSWLILFCLLFFGVQALIILKARELSLLNLGHSFALGRNIDSSKLQSYSLFLSLFLTLFVVVFFGVFSFLGLIFPHIIRSFGYFKTNMRGEVLWGPYFAGIALCVVDVICFNATYLGAEFPVGMVSGVIGAFLLILMLLKSRV
jgi:iron complex transport system permease protein